MFERLYAGRLVFWIILTYVFFVIMFRSFRPLQEDELLAGRLFTAALYLLPPLWLLYLKRRGIPDPGRLFPRNTPSFPLTKGVLWIALAMIFRSFSIITLYGLLAIAFPAFVEEWLLRESRIVYGPGQAEYPFIVTVLSLFLALVLAPISEEILFRGALLHRIWHKWGLAPAIFGSSFLFALLHAEFFGTFVFSVFLSLIYLHTRNLLYPMFFHFLNNALAAAGDIVRYGRSDQLTIDWLRENWWTGIPAGIISLPLIILLLKRNWPRVNPF
jgi:uncharacterized protein